MDCVATAETVEATERIVDDYNLLRAVCIVFQLGEEEGESECTSIACLSVFLKLGLSAGVSESPGQPRAD